MVGRRARLLATILLAAGGLGLLLGQAAGPVGDPRTVVRAGTADASPRVARTIVQDVVPRVGSAVGGTERIVDATAERLADLLRRRESWHLRNAGALRAARDRALVDAETQAELGRRIAAERVRVKEQSALLTGRLAQTEAELERTRAIYAATSEWLAGWGEARATGLETVLAGLGPDLARTLLQRAGIESDGAGAGGALVQAGLAEPDAEDNEAGPPALARMLALDRLVTRLPLVAPLERYTISSGFGPRRDPIRGVRAQHNGLDLVGQKGASVLAPADGVVVRAGLDDRYGLMVEVDHGLGITTLYAHLRKISVPEGARVTFRQELGVIGSTGRSTGRHLHYEMRIDGVPSDPSRFLEAGRSLPHVLQG